MSDQEGGVFQAGMRSLGWKFQQAYGSGHWCAIPWHFGFYYHGYTSHTLRTMGIHWFHVTFSFEHHAAFF